jgi:hypothetical protein
MIWGDFGKFHNFTHGHTICRYGLLNCVLEGVTHLGKKKKPLSRFYEAMVYMLFLNGS